MSVAALNKKLLKIGKGLLRKVKYGFSFSYSQYELFDLQEQRREALEQKRLKSLYHRK